jgi:hypothetical protein
MSTGPEIVRLLEVRENEQAIISVRTKHHISLVFEKMVVDVFEKDGLVFTRIDTNEKREEREEVEKIGVDDDGEEDDGVETQKIIQTPDIVAEYASGHYDHINEAHAEAIALGRGAMEREYVRLCLNDEFYDMCGETQIME